MLRQETGFVAPLPLQGFCTALSQSFTIHGRLAKRNMEQRYSRKRTQKILISANIDSSTDLSTDSSIDSSTDPTIDVAARVRRGRPPFPEIPDNLQSAPSMTDISGNVIDFSQFEGKVVYVLNVASSDDRTDENYKLMAKLCKDYKSAGFEVIAFPSNWFGQRETKSNDEIKEFVRENYSSDIILMNKYDYEENPVFALGQKYYPGAIIWNFHGKFLFDRSGIPCARFDLLTPRSYVINRVRAALGMEAIDFSEETESEDSVEPGELPNHENSAESAESDHKEVELQQDESFEMEGTDLGYASDSEEVAEEEDPYEEESLD